MIRPHELRRIAGLLLAFAATALAGLASDPTGASW